MNSILRGLGRNSLLLVLSILLVECAAWAADSAPSTTQAAQPQAGVQLRRARPQHDRNEQAMLNAEAWTGSGAPVATAQFDQQKTPIDQVIKDLEIGAAVHRSTIKSALAVPPAAY